jgi:hypothetical protein
MSASACVGYFGLRYEVLCDEVDRLEESLDPRQIAARRAGLSSYWANFGGETERYVLFVGAKLAILGPENDLTNSLAMERLLTLASNTAERLRLTDLTGEVGLHLEWLSDA